METHQKEVLRKAEKSLGQTVYDLTWAGQLWGRHGAIRASQTRAYILTLLGGSVAAFSALSSTYYTASGHAGARASQSPLFPKLVWLGRAAWYLWRALRLSDRIERMVGLRGMSADQLDIRASILRRARRYLRAQECLRAALGRDNLAPDTRALLEVGMGEVLSELGLQHGAADAYERATSLLGSVRPATRVRVWKSLGRYHLGRRDAAAARAALTQGLVLAREHRLHDQVVKIEALLKKVGHGE